MGDTGLEHDCEDQPVEPPLLAYEEPMPPLRGIGLVAFMVFLSLVGIGAVTFVFVLVLLFLDVD